MTWLFLVYTTVAIHRWAVQVRAGALRGRSGSRFGQRRRMINALFGFVEPGTSWVVST
jgi:hypothetical protein